MTAYTLDCRPATAEETAATIQRLKAHTEACIGVKVEHAPFAVVAYENNKLIGSIIGKIYSNWLHLELVWVDEPYRGKGVGKALLAETVNQARSLKLSGIEVWTQSWQAPGFYIHEGFYEYAVLDDFLHGHKRHALRLLL